MRSGPRHKTLTKQAIYLLLASAFFYSAPHVDAGPAMERSPVPANIHPDVELQIRNLHDRSAKKKIEAIRRLGEMGPHAGSAAPYLIELLDSQEKYVTSLERIYNIIAILGSSGVSVMQETMTALVRIGPPAVEPLVGALQHPRAKVRGNAALVLGRIRDERSVASLIAALRDPEPEVRMWAAVGLGEMPNSQSVEPLILMLKDADKNVSSYAAFSLGQIKDRRSVESLIQSLRKGNDAAGAALHEITGERFGGDADKWQEWWNGNKSGRTR